MASRFERIYANMPVCLQNLAVSLKGWQLNRKRYHKVYHERLNFLMRSQWLSADEFKKLQAVELQKLIVEAVSHVPYYRKTLAEFKNKSNSISFDSLKDIPKLEKSLLRTNINEFINRERLKFGFEEGHTSGTSGIPMIWPYDSNSMQFCMALRERQYKWAGAGATEKSARFSGKLLLGRHKSPPYYRYNMREKQWLFSSYHLTDKTASSYFEALQKINVAFIDGYPSAIFALAKWINEQGENGLWRPWMINTTAETLMDFQREEIEKAFGCRVFNHYSSSEGAPFVTECIAGNLHLNPESGIIEFLRPDGTDAEPGEEAEMVVTSFFQRTVPLIRYRIGDTGVLAENQYCPCGRQMPVVKYIGGRESDTLYSPERGRIGSAALSTTLYILPSRLKTSQIEQAGEKSFVFRYVSIGAHLNDQEKKKILEQLHNRLGNSVQISLEHVDDIPKGAGGKSRLIIGLKNKSTKG